jgi:hypothetical protein
MKIFIIAAAVLIGISCADARASDNGAATGSDSVSVGGLKNPPLRTIRAGSSFVHGLPPRPLITLRPTGISQPGTSGVRDESTAHECASIQPTNVNPGVKP